VAGAQEAPVRLVCQECGEHYGDSEPLDVHKETTGVCRPCLERLHAELDTDARTIYARPVRSNLNAKWLELRSSNHRTFRSMLTEALEDLGIGEGELVEVRVRRRK
jgi:hypothetical protein